MKFVCFCVTAANDQRLKVAICHGTVGLAFVRKHYNLLLHLCKILCSLFVLAAVVVRNCNAIFVGLLFQLELIGLLQLSGAINAISYRAGKNRFF